MKQIPLHLRMYWDISRKIIYNEYKCGEILPTHREMCRIYNASDTTTKRVTKQLKDNGYIDAADRRAFIVVFDPDIPEIKNRLRTNLLENRGKNIDLLRTFAMVLPTLYVAGIKNASLEDLDEIRSTIIIMREVVLDSTAYWRNHHRLTLKLLQLTNNKDVVAFFHNAVPNLLIPLVDKRFNVFFQSRETILDLLTQAVEQADQDMDSIIGCKEVSELFSVLILKFVECMDRIQMEDKIYSGNVFHPECVKDPVYIQIFTDLMNDYLIGKYKTGDLIPSERELARHYGVEVRTARKSTQLLMELGLIKTGERGTWITAEDDLPLSHKKGDYNNPNVSRRLIEFNNALHFLSLISVPFCLRAAPKMNRWEIKQLHEQISLLSGADSRLDLYCFLHIIDCLASKLENGFFKELYETLRYRLFWGLYISDDPSVMQAAQRQRTQCLMALECLSDRQYIKFSKIMSDILAFALSYSKKLCTIKDRQQRLPDLTIL